MGIPSRRVFDSKNPDDTALNREGFVGVDPVYQNYANGVDKPLEASEESDEDKGAEEPKSTEKPADEKSGQAGGTTSSKGSDSGQKSTESSTTKKS